MNQSETMPDSADNGTLTARQSKLIACLLTHGDTKAACAAAGVARRTAYDWMQAPAFRAALADARGRAMSDSIEAVRRAVTRAAGVLDRCLDSVDEHTRLKAAVALLGLAMRWHNDADLSRRMDALEAATAGAGGEP